MGALEGPGGDLRLGKSCVSSDHICPVLLAVFVVLHTHAGVGAARCRAYSCFQSGLQILPFSGRLHV